MISAAQSGPAGNTSVFGHVRGRAPVGHKPDRGILTTAIEAVNQDGQTMAGRSR